MTNIATSQLRQRMIQDMTFAVSSLEARPIPAERGGRWHPATAEVRQPLTTGDAQRSCRERPLSGA